MSNSLALWPRTVSEKFPKISGFLDQTFFGEFFCRNFLSQLAQYVLKKSFETSSCLFATGKFSTTVRAPLTPLCCKYKYRNMQLCLDLDL
jgi:hypothetical protein